MMIEFKNCKSCLLDKPKIEFGFCRRKFRKPYLDSFCKDCRRIKVAIDYDPIKQKKYNDIYNLISKQRRKKEKLDEIDKLKLLKSTQRASEVYFKIFGHYADEDLNGK